MNEKHLIGDEQSKPGWSASPASSPKVHEISRAERRKAKERYAYRKTDENESMQRVGNCREDILQLHGDIKNIEK